MKGSSSGSDDAGLLDVLPFAAMLIDAEGLVVRSNPAIVGILGRHPEEIAGLPIAEALGNLRGASLAGATLDGLLEAGGVAATVVVAAPGEEGALPARHRLHLRRFPSHGTARFLGLFEPVADDDERLLEVRRLKHELSNLLMGCLGNAELLNGQDLSERARGRARTIAEECRRMHDCLTRLDRVLHRG
jgi:PAS domain-containing protein